MFASSQLDVVVGLDIHMEMVPIVGVPTPTPFPMPYVGMIEFTPGGLLISIGVSAVLSWAFSTPPTGPVLVNSLHATKTGDESKNTKTLPHIVMPPGVAWTPLPKPLKLKVSPPPAAPDPPAAPPGDAVFITGSKTVLFERSNACRLGSLAMSCGDPVRLPLSTLIAVPKGLPVLVGGPPAIDYMAAAKAFFLRNKWTAGLLQQLVSLLAPGRLQDLLGWAACVLTGHPVDVATGRLLTRSEDYVLRGPIPLAFERFYSTGWAERDSSLGHGWSHTFDERVWVERGRVVYKAGDGRELEFHTHKLPGRAMREGQELFYPIDRLWLRCLGGGRYTIRSADGLTREFERLPGSTSEVSRLTRIGNRSKQFVSFEYGAAGHLESVRTSEGRWIRLEHDARGKLRRLIVPSPSGGNDAGWYDKVSFKYSPEGDLVAASDSAGRARTYEYDAHLLVAETDRDGVVFYFQYDGRDSKARCVRTWGDDKKGCADLYFRTITYDLANRRTFVEDSRKQTTVYEMNVANMVIKTVDPHGAPTVREFDENLWLLSETNAEGHRTEFRYDARGNQIARKLPNGAAWKTEYSDEDLPVRTTDPLGLVSQFDYDTTSRLITYKSSAGESLHVEYDRGFPSQITRSDGAKTRFERDEYGQIARTVFPDGTEEQRKCDRQGRVIKVRDAAGRVRRAQYDLEGRLVHLEHAGGIPQAFRHSGEGDVIEEVRSGRRREFGYSHYHRIAHCLEAGERIALGRDAEGELVHLDNEAGERYQFVRDACGRVVEETTYEGRRRTFVRDRLGRVIREFAPDKGGQEVELDAVSNVTRVKCADGTEESFKYDLLGRLVSATNATGTVALTRDARGRIVREAFGDAWIETERDSLGRGVQLSTSMGANETIRRDVMGAVTSVALRSGWNAHFDRDAVGAETRRQLPGGVETRTSWDEAGRPRGLVLRRQGDVLAETQYGWSGLDTLQSKSDVIGGDGEDYLHDAWGRLAGSRSKVDGRTTWRAPSATGNLFKTAERTDRRYGKGGVLLEDAGTVYTYDANGSVVEKRLADGRAWRYAWSAAGRLLQVTTADGRDVRFEYDALGRRVAKHAGARTTRWLWNGNVPVHEWADGGGPGGGDELTTWLFEPESFAPMAKVVRRGGATKAYSIVSDYLGTPREMVDEAGKVAWKAQLDVYGVAHVETGAAEDCPWRWPGQYEDEETGLYYNRFRYYDAESGAYISQDPLRLVGGVRLFGYVPDPLIQTDVLGLTCNDDPSAARDEASSPQSATALSKQLASDAQLGELDAGSGERIAGAGARAPFRDADRIAQTYGGSAADWAKMSSTGFKAADGTTFATHWVENLVTGEKVEPKVVIDIFGRR